MEGWQILWCGRRFELKIAGEITDKGVEDTLRTVGNHLTRYASAKSLKKLISKRDDIGFSMQCTPSVLERFIELYDSQQPAFLSIYSDLTSPVTKEDTKRYLLALASTYSQHWATYEHEPTKRHLFVCIDAPAPALLPEWALETENDPDADKYWMQWHGEAQYDYSGEPDHDEDNEQPNMGNPVPPPPVLPGFNGDARSGFVMMLSRALMLGDKHIHGEQGWSRGYPCAAAQQGAPGHHPASLPAVGRPAGAAAVHHPPRPDRQ